MGAERCRRDRTAGALAHILCGQFEVHAGEMGLQLVMDVKGPRQLLEDCLLYTSDAADERSSVDLGGRRIIKKKNLDNSTMRDDVMSKTNTRLIAER